MKIAIMAGASALALFAAGAAFADPVTISPPPVAADPGVDSYVSTAYANAQSSITQTGTDTSAVVLQNYDGKNNENNASTITQIGEGNGTAGDSAYAVVMQVGGSKGQNVATVSQDGSTMSALAYQKGDALTATVYQSMEAPPSTNNANGNLNPGDVAITGPGQIAAVKAAVDEYANTPSMTDTYTTVGAAVLQKGVDYSATINQETNPSSALITQVGYGAGSTSYIQQNSYGGSNVATSYQHGAALTSKIVQGGDETAHVDQEGENESSNVYQSGYANSSLTFQIGTNNTSQINQYGGAGSVADVDQEASDGFSNITQSNDPGVANTAKVIQTTNNALSTVYQQGTNNNSYVLQGAAPTLTRF